MKTEVQSIQPETPVAEKPAAGKKQIRGQQRGTFYQVDFKRVPFQGQRCMHGKVDRLHKAAPGISPRVPPSSKGVLRYQDSRGVKYHRNARGVVQRFSARPSKMVNV